MKHIGCILGLLLLAILILSVIGVLPDRARAGELIDWISPVMEPVEMPYQIYVPRVAK